MTNMQFSQSEILDPTLDAIVCTRVMCL